MPESTNLQYATHGGVTVARITVPTISERECPGLLFDLSAAAQATGGRLVLDLSEVLMITSAGLGMFVNLRKACTAARAQRAKSSSATPAEDINKPPAGDHQVQQALRSGQRCIRRRPRRVQVTAPISKSATVRTSPERLSEGEPHTTTEAVPFRFDLAEPAPHRCTPPPPNSRPL